MAFGGRLGASLALRVSVTTQPMANRTVCDLSTFRRTRGWEGFLKLSSAVQQQGYGPVIQKPDIHMSLKGPGFHVYAESPEFGDHAFVQGHGGFRPCGFDKTGSTPFATVTVKGELADQKYGATDITESEVHFSVSVFKDSQPGDFSSQPDHIFLGIIAGNSKQDQESSLNLPHDDSIDRNGGFRNALDDGAHVSKLRVAG